MLRGRAAIAFAMTIAGGQLAQASPYGAPRISGVVFTEAQDGSYSASITGLNFGPSPQLLIFYNIESFDAPVGFTLDHWRDTEITLHGLAFSAADIARVQIYSATSRRGSNTTAWAGAVTPVANAAYEITGLHLSGTGAGLTITLRGRGFGASPAGAGPNSSTNVFHVNVFDPTSEFTGTAWNAGYCGVNECDGVTLNYTSWGPEQIVVSGFGGAYGSPYAVKSGDTVCVEVWNSGSATPGQAGGLARCARAP